MQTIPLLERAEEVPLKCLVSRTAEQVHVCLFLHFRLLWSSTVVRATFDGISCYSVMPLGRTRSRFTFLQKKDEKTTAKICSQRMGALLTQRQRIIEGMERIEEVEVKKKENE